MAYLGGGTDAFVGTHVVDRSQRTTDPNAQQEVVLGDDDANAHHGFLWRGPVTNRTAVPLGVRTEIKGVVRAPS